MMQTPLAFCWGRFTPVRAADKRKTSMFWKTHAQSFAVLFVLSACVALFAACDDSPSDTFHETKQPIINSDKKIVSFSVVQLNESSAEIVKLVNDGEGDLLISDMTIAGQGAELFKVRIQKDVDYAGEDLTLLPKEERELQVVFTPTSVGSASAALTIHCNDPGAQEYTITLNALEIGPQPQVSPNPVVFGQVKADETETQKVTVANVGSAPLTITNISISGSLDFTPEVGTRENVTFPAPPLEPNASFELRIIYAPPSLGPDVAKLIIDYEFGGEPRQYTAEITANGADPCIRITPSDQIDFGQAIIGEATPKAVTIENCGNKNLTLFNIALGTGTAPEFELANLPPEIEAQAPVVLAKDSSRQFLVLFTPAAEDPYAGTLVIESDAPSRKLIEMPIYGVGTYNNCPVAVAKARVRGSSDPFSDQLVAAPLEFLEFSSAESSDPDGNAITNYHWSIIAAPDNFALSFQPRAESENPEIQLALVGDYVFELTVTDEHGRESCTPSRVTVRAKSAKQLVIELTWRTPSDFDETDTCMGCGTDLDLHFLRPGGIWDDKFGHSDAHFRSTRADLNAWGAVGIDDNPGLNRDDVDGGGPEQIDVRAPAFTDGSQPTGYNEPYEVGVYYYQDWNFAPPVLASVRIFFNGEETPSVVLPTVAPGQEAALQMVVSDPSPAAQGHFWHVGYLDWDATGGSFTETPTNSQPGLGFPN